LVVNVVCRNYRADRVIPRFGRYLRDLLGWTLTARPDPAADVVYLSGYFEEPLIRGLGERPLAAYFTHREEEPPGNGKARLFDRMAAAVDLRITTAGMYAGMVADCGPTAQIVAPVERMRFTIPQKRPLLHSRPQLTVGFSGYTYGNGRKGERMARKLVDLKLPVVWKASGRGWPVPTQQYKWSEMAGFYQSLDVLVVTALVEGVPMPPLEALACGVSVVIPRGVGLLDELPETPGIHRYKRGDVGDCARALRQALKLRPALGDEEREALRAVTEPYTVLAWCEQHRQVFNEVFG
jgi:glycosyltransferase involved in cell wall biosynthesis